MADTTFTFQKDFWFVQTNGKADIEPFNPDSILLDRKNKIDKIKQNIQNGKTYTR